MATTAKQDRNFVDGLIQQLSSMDTDWVLEWVVRNFYPHEVFGQAELEAWAKDNGYIKEE